MNILQVLASSLLTLPHLQISFIDSLYPFQGLPLEQILN